jgi:hypothetical protein
LVIDEVSMMGSGFLDKLNFVAKRVRNDRWVVGCWETVGWLGISCWIVEYWCGVSWVEIVLKWLLLFVFCWWSDKLLLCLDNYCFSCCCNY